jgi:hypothetical protein
METVSIGGAPTGMEQMLQLAQMLSDPQKLAEEHAKLEAARAEAEAVIALVGPAKEILTRRMEADAVYAEALATRDTAISQAARVVGAANDKAEAILAEARAHAVTVAASADGDREAARKERDNVTGALMQARDSQAAAERAVAKLESEQRALLQLQDEARDLQAQYRGKLDRLNALKDYIAQSLSSAG